MNYIEAATLCDSAVPAGPAGAGGSGNTARAAGGGLEPLAWCPWLCWPASFGGRTGGTSGQGSRVRLKEGSVPTNVKIGWALQISLGALTIR